VKHFQVTIRESDNTKSVLVVPAERQSDIAKFLKDLGVTCGWGTDAHAWPTFKWNAIISNNRCPSYPNCQG
jgi:hypothetical protein